MPGSDVMMLVRVFKKAGISDESMPLDFNRSIRSGLRLSIKGDYTTKKPLTEAQVIFIRHSVINRNLLSHSTKTGILMMISLSDEPQFSAEDIYEIPAGVGRTHFEFDTNLLKVCHPLFQMYYSNEKLANDLIRARVILKSDTNLSTQAALIVRFKTRKASLSFIHRLNTYLHKCVKQRESALETLQRREKEARPFQKELGTHPASVA
jgi:hypothetical protein